jgi:hypothetical protein
MNAEYHRLEAEAREVEARIARLIESAAEAGDTDGVRLETQQRLPHQRLEGPRQGMMLLRRVESPELRRQERRFIASLPKSYYSQGCRKQVVRLRGGVTVTLGLRYYHPAVKPEQVAKHGCRGVVPMRHLLGIAHGFTPDVRQRMARCVTLLGSFEEAAAMLAAEGFDVCVNTLRQVTAGMGAMLSRLTKAGSVKVAGNVKDRRLVVSTDGGRVRLREKRRGKSKKGRKRFRPTWREPRLFIIYAVDEHGRLDPKFAPIIDGTLGSCDQLFRLLLSYLKSLNAQDAKKVLFVADGATWIWRRVPSLIKSLGLAPEQTRQQIDFWHAVEYLGKIAESSKLSGGQKSHWLTVQKRRLKNGEIGSVVTAIEELTAQSRTRDQTTWLNYFVNHGLTHRRMDYASSKSSGLPLGSGAIESAIRRVINLRVKSNATYWLRENGETMIRLRAWIKSGRDEELFHQTTYVTPELLA